MEDFRRRIIGLGLSINETEALLKTFIRMFKQARKDCKQNNVKMKTCSNLKHWLTCFQVEPETKDSLLILFHYNFDDENYRTTKAIRETLERRKCNE